MRLSLDVLEVGHVRTHERSLLVAARACLRHGPLVVTPRELQLHRREANLGMLEREELPLLGKALFRSLQVLSRQVQGAAGRGCARAMTESPRPHIWKSRLNQRVGRVE